MPPDVQKMRTSGSFPCGATDSGGPFRPEGRRASSLGDQLLRQVPKDCPLHNHIDLNSRRRDTVVVDSSVRKSLEYLSKEQEMGGRRDAVVSTAFTNEINA